LSSASGAFAPSRPSRVWSPARLLPVVALGAWAALFWWLILTERTSLYLSTRTDWVVPVGAVLLTVSVAGRLASIRATTAERIEPRAALTTTVIVLPVVLIVATPPSSLGTFAADRRGGLAVGAGPIASTSEITRGRVTLVDVAGALRSRQAMRALVGRAGTPVTFVGFVDRAPHMPADEFYLTRFLVTCCAADAVSLRVRIVGAPPGKLKRDEWVKVNGTIYPLGREVLVHASQVSHVDRPKSPYLNG
jgi:putative membrane protein